MKTCKMSQTVPLLLQKSKEFPFWLFPTTMPSSAILCNISTTRTRPNKHLLSIYLNNSNAHYKIRNKNQRIPPAVSCGPLSVCKFSPLLCPCINVFMEDMQECRFAANTKILSSHAMIISKHFHVCFNIIYSSPIVFLVYSFYHSSTIYV